MMNFCFSPILETNPLYGLSNGTEGNPGNLLKFATEFFADIISLYVAYGFEYCALLCVT